MSKVLGGGWSLPIVNLVGVFDLDTAELKIQKWEATVETNAMRRISLLKVGDVDPRVRLFNPSTSPPGPIVLVTNVGGV